MRHIIFFGAIFFGLVLSHGVWGQSFKRFQSDYQTAKELIEQEEYAQATTFLRELIVAHPNNIYESYASFFYAYASYQLEDYDQARDILLQLLQRYPDWEKIQEARYLMGAVQFARQKPKFALRYLQKVDQQDFGKRLPKLKKAYLTSLSKAALRDLYREFPEEEVIARLLADRIAEQVFEDIPEGERIQLDQIADQFGYKPPKIERAEQQLERIIRKDRYYIGAFLPLKYAETQENPVASPYKFAWELYQGMKLGAERLRAENIPIDLLSFDTQRNPDYLQEQLEEPNMENLDLILGPLFSETVPVALDFAREHETAVVNPISVNAKLLDDYEHYYLSEPSYVTQAEKLADFAIDSLKRSRFYILYGSDQLDSLRAVYFQKAVEKRDGVVRVFERIDPNDKTYINVHEAIKDIAPQALDPGRPIEDGDPDVLIFASTTQQALASTINSRLLVARLRIPVIAPAEWLEMSQLKLTQFNERQIYLFAPDYLDKDTEAYRTFLEDYYQQARIEPSVYAIKGFETVYVWGKILNKHGKNFWKALPEDMEEIGYFEPGFRYQGQRDNAILPILQMRENALKVIHE